MQLHHQAGQTLDARHAERISFGHCRHGQSRAGGKFEIDRPRRSAAGPYLEYKQADSTTDGTGGGDIGYGSQTEIFGSIRTTFRF